MNIKPAAKFSPSDIRNWNHQPYTKKVDDIEKRSFAVEKWSAAGRSLKSFQNISPKSAKSRDSLKSLMQKDKKNL